MQSQPEKNNSLVENVCRELSILITEADKYDNDFRKMSDFFGGYITQLSRELSTKDSADIETNIPITNLSILNDVLQYAKVVMGGDYGYIPDFNNLPHDIKIKLHKGEYTLGPSRQVDGNVRPVILNEKGVRIKDVTLKTVKNNMENIETLRSIAIQAQLKQINEKLAEIQELQSFQIDRDRDHAIFTPFLNARTYILRAQESYKLEDREDKIKKATDELTTAINAVYTDIRTITQHLIKLTRFPVFRKQKLISSYIQFITEDVQVLPTLVGMQMHVFDYLGDTASSKSTLEGYQSEMAKFFTKPVARNELTTAQLIHENFSYDTTNLNCWLNLSKQFKSALPSASAGFISKPIYLVSVEDTCDEQTKQ